MAGSDTIEWWLFGAWALIALPLAFTRLNGQLLLLFSCLAGAPFLIYDTYRFGLPEMLGIFHVLGVGFMPVILRWAVRRRWYRPERDEKDPA